MRGLAGLPQLAEVRQQPSHPNFVDGSDALDIEQAVAGRRAPKRKHGRLEERALREPADDVHKALEPPPQRGTRRRHRLRKTSDRKGLIHGGTRPTVASGVLQEMRCRHGRDRIVQEQRSLRAVPSLPPETAGAASVLGNEVSQRMGSRRVACMLGGAIRRRSRANSVSMATDDGWSSWPNRRPGRVHVVVSDETYNSGVGSECRWWRPAKGALRRDA